MNKNTERNSLGGEREEEKNNISLELLTELFFFFWG